ncbi:MAG TPA: 16S rRNA (cytosine(1402)-N(4))-methyltransferase RsmH, partial [Planctomycetaceae bacterium]|nr:16S rRNA (cytosine(1402)-N(4))-methyltransferase RsmH [Planctomycetaceae bacterium]
EMILLARRRRWPCPVVWVCGDFAELKAMLAERRLGPVDGVLLDLGVCSDQLEDPGRGMSFSRPGPLDMRFNRKQGQPAAELVNRLSEAELSDLLFRYGEERYSRRIARAIVSERQREPIETTDRLAQIVRRAVAFRARGRRIDPATRAFQALRIAVNDELGSLERGLRALPEVLKPGGRAVVISFHSLEDRIVKRAFQQRDFWEPLTPKPVRPEREEVRANPRARSAKLRAARRRC